MTGFATYPALLPTLRDAWGLNNSAAGLLSGIYFGGYMTAVPVLVGLTDRVDPRRVYFFATLLSALGAAGFALVADGIGWALACQAVAGAGLAGTYMPGLKALADRIEGRRQSRSVAFYTASFGIGGSLSLWLAGRIAEAAGWRAAFGVAALGPIAAAMIVLLGIPPQAPSPSARASRLLDFRPAWRNRAAAAFIAGYAAHCWELFGLRSWIVAFFVFAGHPMPWSPATAAAAINLLGPGMSVLGNELAGRAGRRRVILGFMGMSALLGLAVGFAAPLPWPLMLGAVALYFLAIVGDSAALTAGVVAAARPEQRGATIAAHSFVGFGAGFLAPLVFGLVLDAAGRGASGTGWALAFSSLAAACGAGILAFVLLGRHTFSGTTNGLR
jgi:MFS family permease